MKKQKQELPAMDAFQVVDTKATAARENLKLLNGEDEKVMIERSKDDFVQYKVNKEHLKEIGIVVVTQDQVHEFEQEWENHNKNK